VYYIIIVLLVAADQIIKFFISSNMDLGETIPLIENILHITYITNSGGAFSILQGQRFLLILVTSAMTSAILVYIFIKRNSEHFLYLLSLSMICAGGAGNLIDRVRLGAVVDFIDFRVFPIFNLADICVCTGCGLLLLYIFLFEVRRGKVA